MNSPIVILGAFGFLGTALKAHLEDIGFEVHGIGRPQGGRTSKAVSLLKDFEESVSLTGSSVAINLAALTDVDYCQAHPERAYDDNVEPVRALSELRKKTPVRVVHVSTDQVYGGKGPHSEQANTTPVNVYGETKLRAEAFLDLTQDLVIRTNFIGKSNSPRRASWTDWLVKSLSSGQEVRIDPRVQFSPLHVHDLCRYISLSLRENISGLFNLGSSTSVTKIRFAREFASDMAFDHKLIRELEPAAIVARAPRPLDLRLDSRRFESRSRIKLPNMSAVHQRAVADYTSSSSV